MTTVPVLVHRLGVFAAIVVVGGGVGLVDFGDGDLTILGFPTLGGLFDLPGLPFGGRVIDLYVYVSHCRIRGA